MSIDEYACHRRMVKAGAIMFATAAHTKPAVFILPRLGGAGVAHGMHYSAREGVVRWWVTHRCGGTSERNHVVVEKIINVVGKSSQKSLHTEKGERFTLISKLDPTLHTRESGRAAVYGPPLVSQIGRASGCKTTLKRLRRFKSPRSTKRGIV